MNTLLSRTAAQPATERGAEDVLAQNGLSGAAELFAPLRAGIARIELLVSEKAGIVGSISETEQRLADRQRELVSAKARVQAEIAELAIASDDCPLNPLESEVAADALTRQVEFLKARIQGLRGKLEEPNRRLALASAELQNSWDQLRERLLAQFLSEFCAAALVMKGVMFRVLGFAEGFQAHGGEGEESARWKKVLAILFETTVENPKQPGEALINFPGGRGAAWNKCQQAADLHGAARELAAAVKSALKASKGE